MSKILESKNDHFEFKLMICNNLFTITSKKINENNKNWETIIEKENFKSKIPSLKNAVQWEQLIETVEEMFKGECGCIFPEKENEEKNNLTIECTEKYVEKLIGKIEVRNNFFFFFYFSVGQDVQISTV